MQTINYLPTQGFTGDITGVWINKGAARDLTFTVLISGSDVAASLVVQTSSNKTDVSTYSTTAVTSSSDPNIEVATSAQYVRLFCDYTSGTGDITVSASIPALAPAILPS